ncbi:DUF6053 domain-containing protein [Lysobacter enzymogenes]|uniref:DUF6053 domain-containing protein n=1 Tax=Lysobacter enzymogenes TaxID=69 RepID=UPI003CCCA355
MGGTSVPMLSVQIAATRHNSVGTEVPPTRGPSTEVAYPLKSLPQAPGDPHPDRATLRLIAASMNRCRLAAASRTRSNSTSATGVEKFDA